jgi:hypothetical protein
MDGQLSVRVIAQSELNAEIYEIHCRETIMMMNDVNQSNGEVKHGRSQCPPIENGEECFLVVNHIMINV